MDFTRGQLELIYQLLDREVTGLEMALPEARATDRFLPGKTGRAAIQRRLEATRSLSTRLGAYLREDWQGDVDDNGTATGCCPKCEYRAHYELDAKLKMARWVCQNPDCQHWGPWEY